VGGIWALQRGWVSERVPTTCFYTRKFHPEVLSGGNVALEKRFLKQILAFRDATGKNYGLKRRRRRNFLTFKVLQAKILPHKCAAGENYDW